MENILPFLSQRVIAVVGVSTSGGKYGNIVMSHLKARGYIVYGINAKGGQAGGHILYPTLAEAPEKPDVVVFVVPPAITENVLKDVKHLNIDKVWLQPGTESKNAIDYCINNNISIIHNRCIMVQT